MIGDNTVVGTWVAHADVVVVHLDRKLARSREGGERGKARDGRFGQIGSKRLLGIVIMRMTSGAVESLLVVCLTAS